MSFESPAYHHYINPNSGPPKSTSKDVLPLSLYPLSLAAGPNPDLRCVPCSSLVAQVVSSGGYMKGFHRGHGRSCYIY